MKRVQLIAGVTAALPVAAAGGFAAPVAAHAANVMATGAKPSPVRGKAVQQHGLQRHDMRRVDGGPGVNSFGPGFYSLSVPETAYFRSGGTRHMSSSEVDITCYYTGNTGYHDPFWDHFTKWYSIGHTHFNQQSGHIADAHVDMEGKEAPDNGIPLC